MTSKFYNKGKQTILNGTDLSSDTIKVALFTSSYSPDIDADQFFSDISANESSGTGYTAGGEALANVSVTQDNTDDEGVFDADDTTWSNATLTFQYAVIYKDTGDNSTSPLICYVDFEKEYDNNNGNVTFNYDSEGIINLN